MEIFFFYNQINLYDASLKIKIVANYVFVLMTLSIKNGGAEKKACPHFSNWKSLEIFLDEEPAFSCNQ